MSFELKGKLTDSSGNPLSNYTIRAYDKDFIFDDPIGTSVTLDDGSFRMIFTNKDFNQQLGESEIDPQIYLRIFDLDGNFHETSVIVDPFTPYTDPSEVNQCEAVVTGSGFGGTIISLSLVNKFVADAAPPGSVKKKVVLLERGQWWVSHELPSSPGSHEFEEIGNVKKGIKEFLESNNMPYRTWAYPDNINGLSQFLNTVRILDRRGLYDYRISNRVHTLAASGVGGGSLVYTNVTEKPQEIVLDSWDSNLNLGLNDTNLKKYFDMARGFIGVNKIVTNSSIGDVKLPKAKAFQDAAQKIKEQDPSIVTNESTFDPSDLGQDKIKYEEDIFAVDLSITDIPYRKDENTLFKKSPYLKDVSEKYSFSTILNNIQGTQPENKFLQEKIASILLKYNSETNVCQRQGRCAIGCIPGARHTNNKKIFEYLRDSKKKDHFEVRALCEVYDIEPLTSGTLKYKVYYNDYSSREQKQVLFNGTVGSQSYKLEIRLFRFIDKGTKKTIECNQLILSAGAIGSTEILLKSINTTRTTGQKLSLSNKLGEGYSTNGDLLGVVNPTKTDISATRGPIVTSAIKFNEGAGLVYTLEDSNIPKMFAGVSRFLSQSDLFRNLLGYAGTGQVQKMINMITQNSSNVSPNITLPIQVAEQDLTKTLLLSGMGTDTSDGTIKLQDEWKNDPNRDMNALNVVKVDFDMNKLVPLFTKMRHSMERIAREIGEKGKDSFFTPLWNPNPSKIDENVTVVLHNLGGCSMGKDRNSGVVNNKGQVYNGSSANLTEPYTDFYVIDGGIVPTSLGVNSSLTIAALSFRIAEHIVGSSNLPVEEATINSKKIYFPR
ncbi:MAG TPA: GMC oxidoreductase [Nitrososphaeraceae archaeon]|nr:GMC oxidoreductase [Nitrososphaeraceae archaeon]